MTSLDTVLDKDGVRLTVDDAVATVTLTNPAKRNAQSPALWRALTEAGKALPGTVRVVVLRGEGMSFSMRPRPAGFHSRGLRRRAVVPRHGAWPGGRARRDHRRVPRGVHLVAPQRPRVDRGGTGPRHRRRLPARPRLRSADRRRGRAVRHARDQPRPRSRPHGHPPPGAPRGVRPRARNLRHRPLRPRRGGRAHRPRQPRGPRRPARRGGPRPGRGPGGGAPRRRRRDEGTPRRRALARLRGAAHRRAGRPGPCGSATWRASPTDHVRDQHRHR